MPSSSPALVAVDGRDALAYVIIRPAALNEPGPLRGITVDAAANGISRRKAAHVLRHVADQWDPPEVEVNADA